MPFLAGKVALVTGGARGLGAASASALARDGASVVVADILDEGQAVADQLGERASFLPLDVTNEQAWQGAIARITSQYGRLDILVNNAGIAAVGPTAEFSSADWARVVAVNQSGVFFGMRAVLPQMIASRTGSIINVSSIEGVEGTPGSAAYVGTKHAVVGMTRSVALEVARHGVRVNCVCPGVLMTRMMEGVDLSTITTRDLPSILASIPMGRAGEVAEVAEMIAFLASDKASYCTGSSLLVDGGWTAGHVL
jgi:3alpha(or 20beta)-hydroxysteroid dehydrogenase